MAGSKCGFYMSQKKRYCGMSTRSGATFCLEHLTEGSERARVPCPLDPNHTVWASNLARHVKKCNKLKQQHANDNEPFYARDLNVLPAASGGAAAAPPEAAVLGTIAVLERIDTARLAEPRLDCKTNEYMETHRCAEVVANTKHARQQSSLIQHMLEHGLLDQTCFVEFGCGRAELSRYVHQVALQGPANEPRFTLIDRASNRMKFDSKFRDDYERLRGCAPRSAITRRARIDIKDLQLDPLLEAGSDYVAVSKHLCGVATDLTLRCLANSTRLSGSGLRGVCIAMCCRHVCDADQYVNRAYLESLLEGESLSYGDFFAGLRRMCSWATSGRREGAVAAETGGHFTNLPLEKREQLGFLARRVVDEGRRRWLQETLGGDRYEVELVRYTTLDVSLENVAMLMYRK